MKMNIIWMFFMKLCSLSCHQKAERSFFFGKYQCPLCARCSGLLVGYLTGIYMWIYNYRLPLYLNIICIFLMFIDWIIQFKEIKFSTNTRRFITGVLCGIGAMGVLQAIVLLIF